MRGVIDILLRYLLLLLVGLGNISFATFTGRAFLGITRDRLLGEPIHSSVLPLSQSFLLLIGLRFSRRGSLLQSLPLVYLA